MATFNELIIIDQNGKSQGYFSKPMIKEYFMGLIPNVGDYIAVSHAGQAEDEFKEHLVTKRVFNIDTKSIILTIEM